MFAIEYTPMMCPRVLEAVALPVNQRDQRTAISNSVLSAYLIPLVVVTAIESRKVVLSTFYGEVQRRNEPAQKSN